MDRPTFTYPYKKRRILLHIFTTICPALIVISGIIIIALKLNEKISDEMLSRYQQEQMNAVIHQSARLGDTLRSITRDMEELSKDRTLINPLETEARKKLHNFYESHKDFVVAGYRMDKRRILQYVEGRDRKGEGHDISSQDHVKMLFATGKNVISGSFKAVEGYYAIAIHVPVFKSGILDGSIATLVRWDGFKDWFSITDKDSDSFTMLLDTEQRIIFHPDPEFLGKTIQELPEICRGSSPLPAGFFYSQNSSVLEGEFFGNNKYVAACHPFTFEGVTYTLVNCAPYEKILEPIYQTSVLTALLVGFSLLIIIASLGYFFAGFQRDKRNWLKFLEEIKKETEEKEVFQKSLNETQDTLLTILNSMDATVHVADMDNHTILFVNQNMEESFNIKEWQNKKCYEVFRNNSGPCDYCSNPKLLDKDGNPTGVYIWEDKNPVTKKWYQNFDRAIKWIDGRMVRLQIATDVTSLKIYEAQQKEMAERLQRAQKMEAIGTLAGGVAHDLNNVLSGIVTYPELLLMDLPKDSPMVPALEAIHNSGVKASEIVSDLLTLGRRGVMVTEPVNYNDIITEYLESPECNKLKSYHPGIRIKTHLYIQLPDIKGSPIHLKKTIMNLVSNAVEAHQKSNGLVEIHTENTYLKQPLKGYNSIIEGEYAKITVADKGMGIAAQDQDRIFEPFYTKKVMGRSGTGLGMAVVWGTVQDHSGYVTVESELGAGTRISLYFPVSYDVSKKRNCTRLTQTFQGNNESILVVDDVPEQLTIAASILGRLNYSVTTASSGEKAIDYIKTGSYDLLLLDMIMDPGMDGLDTYKKVLEYNPDQKAILASGFSETIRVKEALDLGAGAYIKKPYRMEDLGRAVKNELNRA